VDMPFLPGFSNNNNVSGLVEGIAAVATLGILPLVVTVKQTGLSAIILKDPGMCTFGTTKKLLRKILLQLVSGIVSSIVSKCGNDNMIHKTAEECGLYIAYNLPVDPNHPAVKAKAKEDPKAVTAASWFFAPHNRLAYRNMEKLVKCAPVPKGSAPACDLPAASDADLKIFEGVNVGGASVETMCKRMNVDGFLVLKDGRVLHEVYMNGQSADDKHMMFSVTKGITGLLAEILIHEGKLDDSKLVTDYCPELAAADGLTGATVRHVLDMQVACKWDETYPDESTTSDISKFCYAARWLPYPESYKSSTHVPSMFEYCKTIRRGNGTHRMHEKHGLGWHYSTPLSDVLGFVVAAAEGKSLHQIFSERIWSKLGCESDCCIAGDTTGVGLAGSGWCTTLRDAGRYATMIAAGGKFNGQQVVAAEVIDKLRNGGDPAKFKMIAPMGDGGKSCSYISQWYSDGKGTLKSFGIHGQFVGTYANSGVSVVLQSSNKPSDGGIALIVAPFFGQALDAAFVGQYGVKVEAL